MTPQEESDEEYLDDPIRLTDADFKSIEHAQVDSTQNIIDLTDSEDISPVTESIFSTTFTTKRSVNLNLNSISLPHDIKLSYTFPAVTVKLVDCMKYPWFCKIIKSTDSDSYICSKTTSTPKNLSGQHQLTVHEVTMQAKLKHKIRPVGTPYNGLKGVPEKRANAGKPTPEKKVSAGKSSSEKTSNAGKTSLEKKGNAIIIGGKNEKENGITNKGILEQIDFKKNKGLIGMKITQMNKMFSTSLKDQVNTDPKVNQTNKVKTKNGNLSSWLKSAKNSVLDECETVKSHFFEETNKNLKVIDTKSEGKEIMKKLIPISTLPPITPSSSESKHNFKINTKPTTPSQDAHQRNNVNEIKLQESKSVSSVLPTFKSDLIQKEKKNSPTKVNEVNTGVTSLKEVCTLVNYITDKNNTKKLAKENKLKQESHLENVVEKVLKKKQLKNKNENSVNKKSNNILIRKQQTTQDNCHHEIQPQSNGLNKSQKSTQNKKIKKDKKDMKQKAKILNAKNPSIDAEVTNSKHSTGSNDENIQTADKKKPKADKKNSLNGGHIVDPKNVTLMPNKNMIINNRENNTKKTESVMNKPIIETPLLQPNQTNVFGHTVRSSQLVSSLTDKPKSPNINTTQIPVSMASHLGTNLTPLQSIANALSGQNIAPNSFGMQVNNSANVHHNIDINNAHAMELPSYAQPISQHGNQQMFTPPNLPTIDNATRISVPLTHLRKNSNITSYPVDFKQTSSLNHNSNANVNANPTNSSIATMGNELREYYNSQMDSSPATLKNYRHHLPPIAGVLRPTPQVPNNNIAPVSTPAPNRVMGNFSNARRVESTIDAINNMVSNINTNVTQQYPIQTYVSTNRNNQTRHPFMEQNLRPDIIGQNNIVPNFPRPYLRMPCSPIFDGIPRHCPPGTPYWRNNYPQAFRPPRPPPPPPYFGPHSVSKSFEGSTIIGQNFAGPVRKINIVAVPITSVDRANKPDDSNSNSCNKPNKSNSISSSKPNESIIISPNNAIIPHTVASNEPSIANTNTEQDTTPIITKIKTEEDTTPIITKIKTEEDTTPINSKLEMLEELNKAVRSVSPLNNNDIIPTVKPELLSPKNVVRNDLKRSLPETNSNVSPVMKPGPLSKKPKLDVALIPNEEQQKSPRKGYSQPILPIPPTYEETINLLVLRHRSKYGKI